MRFTSFVSMSMLLLVLGQAPYYDNYKMKKGGTCPRNGTATSTKNKKLNDDKNRWKPPMKNDMDSTVTLAHILAAAPNGDENRFNQNKAGTIQGYVVDVKTSQTPETCNCGAADPVDQDTHIEVALLPGCA